MNPADWTLDTESANQALAIFKKARHVLMPTHQNVDADGLASPMALQHALAQIGVLATPLVTDGQIPSNLQFLPGVGGVSIYGRDPLPEYDVMCLTDCSDLRRLGAFYADDPQRVDGSIPIINIDHHVTNDRYGVVQIIEPSAASSAEIVAEVLRSWNTRLTKTIALCLLAGIYGDTLGLRTPATTSRTMRTAANLVDAGINPAPIVDALFRLKPKSTVCVWALALRNVHWTGSLIWTELTAEMLETCGALPSEGEGLVNFLAGTEGSRASAILYANPEGWRVSLRSLPDDVDVAVIASHFGGGGHPRAAGVQINGGESEKLTFLEKVAELAAPRSVLAE